MEDLLTVLNAAGVDRAASLVSAFGGPVGLALAARHPERVSAVVLVNSFARTTSDTDYEVGHPLEVFDELASTADPEQGEASEIDAMAPSLTRDADVRRWWNRESRRGATPTKAVQLWDWVKIADSRDDARQCRESRSS